MKTKCKIMILNKIERNQNLKDNNHKIETLEEIETLMVLIKTVTAKEIITEMDMETIIITKNKVAGNSGSRNFGDNKGNNFKMEMEDLKSLLITSGIDKNIKDIVSTELMEKGNQRDYSTRIIDKQKANRYNNQDDKKRKSRKDEGEDTFNEDKLRNLKQVDKLSNMFEDQEGGMLDYYDLTTTRGKRNKRKIKKMKKEINKKSFDLKEITIPENITVKDLAADLKKTTAEVIKKLFDLGIMATINQSLDFDTAYLVADSFGVSANKKEEIKR